MSDISECKESSHMLTFIYFSFLLFKLMQQDTSLSIILQYTIHTLHQITY